jgi:hypothetical protein
VDVNAPEFGVRKEVRDGVEIHIPTFIGIPASSLDDSTPVAEARFFTPETCPVCNGGPCPECGRLHALDPVVTEVRPSTDVERGGEAD